MTEILTTQRRSTVTLSGQAGNTEDEYDAFEDLARKLVAVPKSEIDAERAKKS